MGLFDFLFKKNKPSSNPANENTMNSMPEDKVEVEPGLSIPRAFADRWNEIKLPRAAVAINATVSDDLTLEQSKFAHYPYLPLDFDYPKDATGEFMYPLAQLNFSEIPPLPGFPTSGYLQFYIAAFDDVYGIDFNDLQHQKNFRVLFFEEEEIRQHKADFSFLDKVMKSEHVPVIKSYAFEFLATNEYVSLCDAEYARHIAIRVEDIASMYPSVENKLLDEGYDLFSNPGHKIGGYAEFTQQDPREDDPVFQEYIQLLQIDSIDDIMWGDVGIAHFFIHPDDLKRKDFSKVLYTWDCH
jgi:uncharacterized protein YwqG